MNRIETLKSIFKSTQKLFWSSIQWMHWWARTIDVRTRLCLRNSPDNSFKVTSLFWLPCLPFALVARFKARMGRYLWSVSYSGTTNGPSNWCSQGQNSLPCDYGYRLSREWSRNSHRLCQTNLPHTVWTLPFNFWMSCVFEHKRQIQSSQNSPDRVSNTFSEPCMPTLHAFLSTARTVWCTGRSNRWSRCHHAATIQHYYHPNE